MASIAPDVREIRTVGNRRFRASGVILVALAAVLPPSDTAVAGPAGGVPPTATVVASLLYSGRHRNVRWLDVGPLGARLSRLTARPPLSAQRSDLVPRWSPDGRRIAFVRRTPAGSALYTIGRDGTGLARVTGVPRAAAAATLAWSVDGPRLAFDRYRGLECRAKKPARLRLTIASAAGLHDVDALPRPESRAWLQSITWLPDGKRLSYIVDKWYSVGCEGHAGDFESLLYVIGSDGRGRKLIARALVFFGRDWSADSRTLAYVASTGSGGCDIAVVRDDGSARRILRHDESNCLWDVGWGPDSATVAAVTVDRLDVIDVPTNGSRTLLRCRETDVQGSILGFSPDGEWVAVVQPFGVDSHWRTTFARVALVPLSNGASNTYDLRPEATREALDDFDVTFR
jgi:dipeptidyl aminopeptidase/acylaminoacyl peptidase